LKVFIFIVTDLNFFLKGDRFRIRIVDDFRFHDSPIKLFFSLVHEFSFSSQGFVKEIKRIEKRIRSEHERSVFESGHSLFNGLISVQKTSFDLLEGENGRCVEGDGFETPSTSGMETGKHFDVGGEEFVANGTCERCFQFFCFSFDSFHW